MAYLLDANVFIQAKNLHYGLDCCPAFWDWLIAGNASKRVFSIEKVGDEIAAGGDQLAEWARCYERNERGSFWDQRNDHAERPAVGSGQWAMKGLWF